MVERQQQNAVPHQSHRSVHNYTCLRLYRVTVHMDFDSKHKQIEMCSVASVEHSVEQHERTEREEEEEENTFQKQFE